MKKSSKDKIIKDIHDEQIISAMKATLDRANSLTVGTCFGGVIEIIMRKHDGSITWVPMQPVEVIELIHQLAASAGCHIHIKPRKDFSSWRQWNDETELLPNNGWPPFSEHPPLAKIAHDPNEQPGLNFKQKKKKSKRTK